MRITIPDEIADVYAAYAKTQNSTLDDVVTAQLTRFRTLEPGKTAVTIRSTALKGLDARLGQTPIRDGEDLLDRIKKLASVSFSHLDIQLSHGQLVELEHRARRQGRSVGALVEDIWRDLQQNFFYSSGGGSAASTMPAHPGSSPGSAPSPESP